MIQIPSPAEIVRRQHTVAIVLRVLTIPLMIMGIGAFGSWALEGVRDGDFWDLSYYSVRMAWTVGAAIGAPMVFLLGPLMGRLVVPRGKRGCPSCGYDAGRQEICPECGHSLRPSVLFPAQGNAVRDPRLVRAYRVHLVATSVRAACLVITVYIVSDVVNSYGQLVVWGGFGGWYDESYFGWYLTQSAGYELVCLGMYLLATPVARAIVPVLPRKLAERASEEDPSALKSPSPDA